MVQIKLLPDAATEAALRETLKLCNQAACHASRRAHATGIKGKTALQRLVYDELKAMGLSAQHDPLRPQGRGCLRHAGREPEGGKLRACRVAAPCRRGGRAGPVPQGRRPAIRRPLLVLADGRPHREHLDRARQTQERSLRLFGRAGEDAGRAPAGRVGPGVARRLLLPVRHLRPPPRPRVRSGRVHRVDLGIVNIATTCDGTVHSGKRVNQVRHRNRRLRGKLQAKGTKSAKRLLRHLSGREARFAADTNHRISKSIVTEAQRTTHGIALEDLGGIRARVRLRKPQRVTLHTWSFAQLGAFIAYKAERAGALGSSWTRATPRRSARRAATSTRRTGPTRPPLNARRAASLSTPTSTQPATSPHAAPRAGR